MYTGSTLPVRAIDVNIIVRATSVRSDCGPLPGRIKEESYVKLWECSF